MTPEGKVKKQVKRILAEYKRGMYYHMPMQNGMGRPSLDFVGAYRGWPFAIETKAGNAPLTVRQHATIVEMENAGIAVFVIRHENQMLILQDWLTYITMLGHKNEPNPNQR